MGGFRSRLATCLFAAALLQLRLCTAEEICSTVAAHGKDVGCTEAFRFGPKEWPDHPQEISRLLYTSSAPEQLFTWLVPTDAVLDALKSSQDVLAYTDDDGSMFTRIVAIVGTVPIPQSGMDVEAQTVSGTTLRLSADASGTVTVSSPESSSVAILHRTIPGESEGSVQRQVPAVNLQSCAGLVHFVSDVHEAAAASSSGGAGDRDLIVGAKHAAGVLSAVGYGEEQQGVQARGGAGGARRLLLHLQRSEQASALAGGARGILQVPPIEEVSPGGGGGGGGNTATGDAMAPEGPQGRPSFPTSEVIDATNPEDGKKNGTQNSEGPNQVEINEVALDAGSPGAASNAAAIELANAPSPSSEPAAAPESDSAMETAADESEATAAEDTGSDKEGFFTSTPFYAIIGVAAAALVAVALCTLLLCCRRGSSNRAGPSKPISVGDRAMYHQSQNYDSNSMQLRQAQAQPPMAVPPSPHMGKPEMEMQSAVGHQPDPHYGAPVHSRGYRGAPDAFGAVSGSYGPAPAAMNNQPGMSTNGKVGEPYTAVPGAAVGAAAVGAAAFGGVAAAGMNAPQKGPTPRVEGANAGAVGPTVSATAPIAGVHANKDIKEKKKRTPDSQKRALQMNKSASAAKRGDGVQVGMPTPSAQRSKPALAAQPLPIMSSVAVSPKTQSEIASLEQKLGSFGPHALLGDRYRLINNVCLAKESSVVVNAQGVKDNLKYTITFFLNEEHYDVERGLYSTAPLKGLVPRAHVHGESDPLTGPDGSPLPRAIVLERGETVTEWVVRRAPDGNVKAEVLRHIALRVRALHDAGYVHCNLSPEAFKWYPRENRWMLCEFGHAARAGDARRAGAGGLADSKITYAAPEGVAIDGRTESLRLRNDVVAQVPLDVWSYAVVALETMFGSPLLDTSNVTEVRAQLGNTTPLPWEDDRMRSIIINSVGDSYATVLFEALQRTASERPSMSALHESWRSTQHKMRNDQDQSVSDLL